MTQFNEVGPASESEKPKKCSCKCKAIVAAILIVLVAGVVCWYVHRPMVPRAGMHCTVVMKSDISSGGTYMVSMTQSGTLIAINREVVILKKYVNHGETQRYQWIPRDNVLFIDYHK